MYFIMFSLYSTHRWEKFVFPLTPNCHSRQSSVTHHIQETHIYIEYLNTSFFTKTSLFSLWCYQPLSGRGFQRIWFHERGNFYLTVKKKTIKPFKTHHFQSTNGGLFKKCFCKNKYRCHISWSSIIKPEVSSRGNCFWNFEQM